MVGFDRFKNRVGMMMEVDQDFTYTVGCEQLEEQAYDGPTADWERRAWRGNSSEDAYGYRDRRRGSSLGSVLRFHSAPSSLFALPAFRIGTTLVTLSDTLSGALAWTLVRTIGRFNGHCKGLNHRGECPSPRKRASAPFGDG